MISGKQLLFILLILGTISCGQKSTVKTDVRPQTFAEAYGDGELVRRSFPLPITTDATDSPVPDFGFLFGGIAKMIANIGVALGAGKTEMYFHQPTPELPKEIKEIRLKRVFFYIEPKANQDRRARWFSRIFRGKGDVDFDFIKKLALRVKPEVADMKKVCLIQDQGKFAPLFPCKDPVMTNERTKMYTDALRIPSPESEPNLSELRDFFLVKYDHGKKAEKIENHKRGKMYMVRTQRPGETSHFFSKRPGYRGLVENMVTMDNVILVELKKDPVVQEIFESQLSADANYLDDTLAIEEIEECTESICLDVKVEKANLLPFLKRLNSNRIDAFIEAARVPESFQLKGFLEVEIGAQLGF